MGDRDLAGPRCRRVQAARSCHQTRVQLLIHDRNHFKYPREISLTIEWNVWLAERTLCQILPRMQLIHQGLSLIGIALFSGDLPVLDGREAEDWRVGYISAVVHKLATLMNEPGCSLMDYIFHHLVVLQFSEIAVRVSLI